MHNTRVTLYSKTEPRIVSQQNLPSSYSGPQHLWEIDIEVHDPEFPMNYIGTDHLPEEKIVRVRFLKEYNDDRTQSPNGYCYNDPFDCQVGDIVDVSTQYNPRNIARVISKDRGTWKGNIIRTVNYRYVRYRYVREGRDEQTKASTH